MIQYRKLDIGELQDKTNNKVLCESQDLTWISIGTCHDHLCVQLFEVRGSYLSVLLILVKLLPITIETFLSYRGPTNI